jgi:hypothetical protein
MASTTGIEIGPESCTLVDVRPGAAGTAVVRAIRSVGSNEWPAHDATQIDLLRSIRRTNRLPRRAAVVAWSLPGDGVDDTSTRTALRFIESAGFRVDSILTPPQALARLARMRRRTGSSDATVWAALNEAGAAIAIVRGRDLLFARTLAWRYKPGLMESRAQLLQRYSLIAHLAPEVRHAIEAVRASHGVAVDGVVTCGDIPELRSLTMPLIEELDLEVETLDSIEGLRAAGNLQNDHLLEAAAAIRLACAAALTRSESVRQSAAAMHPEERSGAMGAVAAIALIGALAWGVFSFRNVLLSPPVKPISTPQRSVSAPRPTLSGVEPTRPAVGSSETKTLPPLAARAESGSPSQTADDRNASRPVSTVLSVRAESKTDVPPAPAELPPQVTAAAPSPASTGVPKPRGSSVENAKPAGTKRAAGPVQALKEPLPKVDSILIDQARRVALIDGSVVHVGDVIGPRTIVQIERDAVILREPSGLVVRASVRSKRES